MLKQDSCRLLFWMFLALAIEIAVISWLFHNSIEGEKEFIRKFERNGKIILEYEKVKNTRIDFSCVGLNCNASQMDTPYGIPKDNIEINNLPSFLKGRVRNGYIYACEKHAKLWGIDKLFDY